MLNNPLGVFLYLMLRNDWAWRLLSEDERALVLRMNRSYNAEREDYANPEQYGAVRMEGGDNWDSTLPRDRTVRGRSLISVIGKLKPTKVLEIGPGAGYFSRTICEQESVKSYTSIDVGGGFLEYLRPRLGALAEAKAEFSFQLLNGTVGDHPNAAGFDFTQVLSCVHHIPDRVEFFRELAGRLQPGGHIFCFDPSHYASRWARLLRGMVLGRYLKRSFYMDRKNLSTHHFCTIGEYRAILRQVPELELVEEYYVPAKKASLIPLATRLFPRLVSIEMGVLLRKRG